MAGAQAWMQGEGGAWRAMHVGGATGSTWMLLLRVACAESGGSGRSENAVTATVRMCAWSSARHPSIGTVQVRAALYATIPLRATRVDSPRPCPKHSVDAAVWWPTGGLA